MPGWADEQTATLRILTGVGCLGERGVTRVPRIEEGVAALFDPSIEVGGGDLVWESEKWVGRIEKLDGGLFIDDAFREAATH